MHDVIRIEAGLKKQLQHLKLQMDEKSMSIVIQRYIDFVDAAWVIEEKRIQKEMK